ncbi:MAG: hypothetical protein LH618_00075, partial [Saprospiraceae bacterium]|nr:hypothetical protein [Saprospiraceae bacterium]
MRYSLPVLLISGLLFSYTSRATTISPFANLLELYLASDAVALVQSGATYETPTTNCTHYDCGFTVVVPLKGSLGVNQVFPLRQYSHYDDTGRLGVSGDFVPQEGHAYLVFLDQRPDGWRLMMLSYYVFEDIFSNNDHYLVPIQESRFLNIAPRPDGTVVEQLATYRRDALLQMLQQQAKGTSTPWNGRPAQATLAIADQMSDRLLPTGCDFDLGTGTSRWQSTNINLYYDITNAPADVVGRVTNVVATLNAQYGLNLVAAGCIDFNPVCT